MLNHSCKLVDIIFVGCVKTKRHRAGPAQDVYTSTLWKYRQAYAVSHGRLWYILSAKHGLLAPSTWIERYDLSLADLTASECREWSLGVLDDLGAEVPALDGKTIEVHAGKLTWNTGWRRVFARPVPLFVAHWHIQLAWVRNVSGIENIWLRVPRKEG